MNKIAKQSQDVLQDLIQKMRELYPSLFNDEKNLNEDELRNLMSNFASKTEGKYEFNWAGKMNAKKNAFTPSRAMLKPDKKRSIDFDKTENLIIEGDNLEVLKQLQKAYSNSVKCIYIDPPYNTGGDFVYSDDFSEVRKAYWEVNGTTEEGVRIDTNSESQGRFHSNWLNMLFSRLLLARNLLCNDGALFISIDEKEVHNLKKILDEIFGEENFAGEIIWKNSSKNDQDYISMQHEYFLFYVKDKTANLGQWLEHKEGLKEIYKAFEDFKKKYKDDWDLIHKEAVKWYKQFPESNPIYNSKHYSYLDENGIFFPSDISGPNYGQYRYDLVHPITQKICKEPASGWRYPKETMLDKVKHNLVYFGKDETTVPKNKTYLKDTEEQSLTSVKYKDGRVASNELKKILGGNYFENPKDVSLIKLILSALNVVRNDLMLDFFAGSGTTAQAILEMNKKDGGNRKYILVQIPEQTDAKSEAYKAGYKTISQLCIERVKRVSNILKEEKIENIDLGFKIFKLAKSFFPENQYSTDPEKSDEENIIAFEKYLLNVNKQLDFTFEESELMYEVLLKDGFTLNFKAEKVQEFTKNVIYRVTDREKTAILSLDGTLHEDSLQKLQGYTEQRFLCLERAVDTTKKWNLKNMFGDNLWVI